MKHYMLKNYVTSVKRDDFFQVQCLLKERPERGKISQYKRERWEQQGLGPEEQLLEHPEWLPGGTQA